MDYQQIELHDARLIALSNDYANRVVTISIEYYPTAGASHRAPASLRFTGVTRFDEISDFAELQSHASAGNVSYWVPAVGSGTTYIHLVRGLIAVTAESLAFAESN